MNGKTAVITGGCGGIGSAIVKTFFDEGVSVRVSNELAYKFF